MSSSSYTAIFRPLSSAWPQRSSHSVALLAPSHGIVFGGELSTNTPAPSKVNAISLVAGSGKILNLGVDGIVPSPRIGASLVQAGETYYLWGGRDGRDSDPPLEGDDAGLFSFTVTDAAVHWKIQKKNAEGAPQGRSNHNTVVLGNKLYVHGGLSPRGPFGDLFSFDLGGSTWNRLADAPGSPRSGVSIAATTITFSGNSGEPALLRWGGFPSRGSDLGLDVYVPSRDSWTTVYPSTGPDGAPGARAAFGFVGVDLGGPGTPVEKLVAVLFFGDREDTSARRGAESYWDDVWGLAQNGETFIWRKLEITGKPPAPRGSFAYTNVETSSSERGRLARILIHGGLFSSGERSGESFLLEVVRRA